ncbi:MAG: 30S ribosomal protein S7 [Nanoarchaeota archaeon]|nr:30S ribosomal protein S7 [Nanoarchaeota archaeon]
MAIKIFDLYDVSEVKVEDMGLKKYINLTPKLVLKSHGREREKFGKTKVNLIERMISLLQVPGHRGKKHVIMTSHATGKWSRETTTVIKAFKLIEQKTKQNPVQVFVKAIENSAPRDEITSIEYGGARYPQAVDVSPYRRVNVALRNIIHGSQDKSFNKKTKMFEALANEIINAAAESNESFALTKRSETEKMADSAR